MLPNKYSWANIENNNKMLPNKYSWANIENNNKMLPNIKRTVRKIHPLVPLAVLLFGLFAGLALVQRVQEVREKAQTVVPEPNLVVSPSTQTLRPGDNLNFTVVMNTGSSSIVGLDMDLNFNPNAIEITSINSGSGISNLDQEIRKSFDNNAGTISYSVFTLDMSKAVSGSNLQALSVAGRVKSTAAQGNYNLSFGSSTSLANTSATNVLAGTGPGTITVSTQTTTAPTSGTVSTRIIENFESYSSNTALRSAYTNDGNTGTLSLSGTYKADGSYGAVFEYSVGTPNYSGLLRSITTESWSGYNAIRFWIRPDNSGRLFAFRLRESGGEVWEGRVTLTGTSATTVQIPFNSFVLVTPVTGGNNALDLGSISAFGFYVHKGQTADGGGNIYFDKFELTSDSGTSVPTSGPTQTPGPTSAFSPTPTSSTVQAADTTLSLSPATYSTFIDRTFNHTVNINTGINEVVGVDLIINFDRNRLEVTNIAPGGFFTNPTESIKNIDNTNGVITYSIHTGPSTAAKKGTGALAVISFRARAEGNANVNISNSTVVGALNTGARNALKSVSGATVSISKVVLLGDINQDGKVDILDYVILFENFGKSPIPDPRADLNSDGVVNILDYVILFENFGRTI